jgi:hypothetical protein
MMIVLHSLKNQTGSRQIEVAELKSLSLNCCCKENEEQKQVYILEMLDPVELTFEHGINNFYLPSFYHSLQLQFTSKDVSLCLLF